MLCQDSVPPRRDVENRMHPRLLGPPPLRSHSVTPSLVAQGTSPLRLRAFEPRSTAGSLYLVSEHHPPGSAACPPTHTHTHAAPASFASRPPGHEVGTQVFSLCFSFCRKSTRGDCLHTTKWGSASWASVSSQTSRCRPHLTSTS